MCDHKRQLHRQTYVELERGEWTPSSLEWICLDCDTRGIKTQRYAFMDETIKRRTKITRDDRNIVSAVEGAGS